MIPTDTSDPARAARLNKLRYRAWHRGFREADLIVGPFADREVEAMTAEELDAFEALLDAPDQHLYAWIVGREPVPAEHDTPVMERLRAFRFQMHAVVDPAIRGG
jgi:antitoxin CptB